MFNHKWSRSLRASVAFLLATSFVVGPIALTPFGPAAAEEPIIESCGSIYNAVNQQYLFPMTFTADDLNGERLNSTEGLTFELRFADGSTLDVSDFVTTTDSYANQFFDMTNSPFNSQFTPALSTFVPRLPTSDGFVLLCSRMQLPEASGFADGTVLPFADGTTLVIKRSNSVIATSSVAQKQPFFSLESALGLSLIDFFSGGAPVDCTGDGNYELCRWFSDFYNVMIENTGQRLHPSLAYVFVALIALQANLNPQLFPTMMQSSAQTTSAPLTPPPFFCEAYFALSLNLIAPGAQVDENIYQLSAIGHGLANSLSNPTNTSWPEFDSCVHIDNAWYLGDYVGFFVQYVLLLHLLQTYISDIPRGVTNASVLGGLEANTVHLAATARIPWQWTDESVQPAVVGRSYTDAVVANGTPAPTYAVTSGALPRGLTLNSATGAITGTPTTSGTFNFTVSATNSVGVLSKGLSISVVSNKPAVSPPTIRATRQNKEVTISGKVDASYKGKRVTLQRLHGKKWVRVKTIPINANKTFSTTVWKRSVIQYRIVAGSQISRTIRK